MVFASAVCILSYQVLNLGVYAHIYAIRRGFLRYDRLTLVFKRYFNLERGILLGGIIFLIGAGINTLIFVEWFNRHFGLCTGSGNLSQR